MLEIPRAFFGLLLTLFLPGFTLTRALFPRKKAFHPDYDMVYQVAIGITLSLIIVILLGVAMQGMGVNPSTGKGYFTVGNITISLLAITTVFFTIGWWRGAYPGLGWFHPNLKRIASSPAVTKLVKDQKARLELHDLVKERGDLIKEIEFCEARAETMNVEERKQYSEKLTHLYQRLEMVNEKIDNIEGGAFQRYAQMKAQTSFDSLTGGKEL